MFEGGVRSRCWFNEGVTWTDTYSSSLKAIAHHCCAKSSLSLLVSHTSCDHSFAINLASGQGAGMLDVMLSPTKYRRDCAQGQTQSSSQFFTLLSTLFTQSISPAGSSSVSVKLCGSGSVYFLTWMFTPHDCGRPSLPSLWSVNCSSQYSVQEEGMSNQWCSITRTNSKSCRPSRRASVGLLVPYILYPCRMRCVMALA
jgi:hypothetical protein